MLEGRTVYHIFNKVLPGRVISADGELIRVSWSDGRIYSHDRKFLCDEFSDLETSIKSRRVVRIEEQDEPDEDENDPNQIGVYELGSEPIQEVEEEGI